MGLWVFSCPLHLAYLMHLATICSRRSLSAAVFSGFSRIRTTASFSYKLVMVFAFTTKNNTLKKNKNKIVSLYSDLRSSRPLIWRQRCFFFRVLYIFEELIPPLVSLQTLLRKTCLKRRPTALAYITENLNENSLPLENFPTQS